ncbi:MAG: DUF4184 family protein [Gammaproteobacteria bacterium]
MPFTLSHPAVVLPFARLLARWRLLSAVVIGAMVPDFGLFSPWRVYRVETHSVTALGSFCLPVGLLTYWIFQYLIKTPVMETLPDGAAERWRAYSSPADIASPLHWILAALGVLAGAVSHLGWDAFTHEGARGVRLIPWLEDPIVEIGSHYVPGVRLMQDGSSLIGFAIVLGFVWYGLRRRRTQPGLTASQLPARLLTPNERHAWVLLYALAGIASGAAWLLWVRAGEPAPHSVTALANAIAVAGLRGLATALLGVSLGLDLRLRALRRESRRVPTVP